MNFRSLIDWIAGRKAPEAATQAATGSERRRYSRLTLTDGEARVVGHEPIPVVNLSFGGVRLALPDSEKSEDWTVGKTLQATIILGSIQFDTGMQVCNVWGREIGCSFQGSSLGVARLISDYLKPRLLGASLREIKSAQPRAVGKDLRLRWFQGDNGTEVYLWERLDGGLVKEELFFLDYCVSWEESGDGLRTARVAEGSGRQGYGRMDQSSMVFFRIPSHRALRMGQVILLSSSLPPEVRDRFLARMAQEERRLYSRYILGSEDAQIRLTLPTLSTHPLSVVNLSLHGIAFLRPEKSSLTSSPAISWEGVLFLNQQEIAVQFKPAFSHGNIMGGSLHFKHLAGSEAVAAYLAPRLLGQSLEEHPA
ncbi:MAG TPA: PilZ domain-containing protein, partial [Candidatus Ozemobacteraceae bacterium]|nr:PilZ domain-containing protein [Candidatus Ozemobacteraceae bacterium]